MDDQQQPKIELDDKQRTESRKKLEQWLNRIMRVQMTDGRTLIGVFLCTDSDCNIIMGSCEEYLKPVDQVSTEEPRTLGLAMIPGKHVVSIDIDDAKCFKKSVTESETQEEVCT